MTTAASIILAASTMFSPFRTGTYFSITGMCFTADGSFGDHDIVETDVPGVSTGAVKRITQGNARAIVAIADGACERLVLPRTWSAVDGDLDEYGSKYIAYPTDDDQRSVDLSRVPYYRSWLGGGMYRTNHWSSGLHFFAKPDERDFNRTAGRTLSRIGSSSSSRPGSGVRYMTESLLRGGLGGLDGVWYSSSMFGGEDFVDYEGLSMSNVIEKVTNAVDSLVYTSMVDDEILNKTKRYLTSAPWYYNPAIITEYYSSYSNEWRNAILNTKRSNGVLLTNLLASAANNVVGESKFAATNTLFDLHAGQRIQSYPLELRAAAVAAIDKTYHAPHEPDYRHSPLTLSSTLDRPFRNTITYSPKIEGFGVDSNGDMTVRLTLGEPTGGGGGQPSVTVETNVTDVTEFSAFAQVDASTFAFELSGYACYDHFQEISTRPVGFADYEAFVSDLPGPGMVNRVVGEGGSVHEVLFDATAQVPPEEDIFERVGQYSNSCSYASSRAALKSPSLVTPGMSYDWRTDGDTGFMTPHQSYYGMIEKVVLQLGCEIWPGPVYYARHADTDAYGMHGQAYLMCEHMRQKAADLFEAQAGAPADRLDSIVTRHMSKLMTEILADVDGKYVRCAVTYKSLVGYIIYDSQGGYSLLDKDHSALPRSRHFPNRYVTHLVTIGGTFDNRRNTDAFSSYKPRFSRAIYWNFKNYPIQKP